MKIDIKLLQSGSYTSYRNIATCSPSQDIFDDLVDESDFEILQLIDNESSGIDHSKPPKLRFQQYGNIEDSLLCFDEKFWAWSRFSNGDFGVWYGSSDEMTSQLETLYHRPEIDKNDLENAYSPIIQDRRMFRAQLRSEKIFDLCPYIKNWPDIMNPTDYLFCQRLGRDAFHSEIDMFITESVRNEGGFCYPVFNPETIISDVILYDYVNKFPLNGSNPMVLK